MSTSLPQCLLLALAVCAPWSACAQAASASGVQVSTDPARAAAIERAAAALKARPARPAVGIVRDKTAAGHPFIVGGISDGDRTTMDAEKRQFNLWVATVARPSGAYLADVDVRITHTKTKAVVLERKLEGPWLMLTLPPGPYDIAATLQEPGEAQAQQLTTRVTVPAKGQREAVLRFSSKATVESDAAASAPSPR